MSEAQVDLRSDAVPDGRRARVRLVGVPAEIQVDERLFRAARPERVPGEREEPA